MHTASSPQASERSASKQQDVSGSAVCPDRKAGKERQECPLPPPWKMHALPEVICVSSTVAIQQWGWVAGGLEFGGGRRGVEGGLLNTDVFPCLGTTR